MRGSRAHEQLQAGAPSRPVFCPQILDPCWCPTELVVKGERKEFPLPPAPSKEFNFTNGAGMAYEARHVHECLRKGEDGGAGVEGQRGEGGGTLPTPLHSSSRLELRLPGPLGTPGA